MERFYGPLDNEEIRVILVPGSAESLHFQVLFDTCVECTRVWIDDIRSKVAKDFAAMSDGSSVFETLSAYVAGQLRLMSFEPYLERMEFPNELFEKRLRERLSDLRLRFARPEPLNWIHGHMTLDVWRHLVLPTSISDLVQGLRTIYCYGEDCAISKDNFERLQAKHGEAWAAYCLALEHLPPKARMDFAETMASSLQGTSEPEVLFQALCEAWPKYTETLRQLLAQPLSLFKADAAFRSPDFFF